MHHTTYRIAHTTAIVTPVVEHWLEREIAQCVHPMKDRSDDPSHHERTVLPRSYISLLLFSRLHHYVFRNLKPMNYKTKNMENSTFRISSGYSQQHLSCNNLSVDFSHFSCFCCLFFVCVLFYFFNLFFFFIFFFLFIFFFCLIILMTVQYLANMKCKYLKSKYDILFPITELTNWGNRSVLHCSHLRLFMTGRKEEKVLFNDAFKCRRELLKVIWTRNYECFSQK